VVFWSGYFDLEVFEVHSCWSVYQFLPLYCWVIVRCMAYDQLMDIWIVFRFFFFSYYEYFWSCYEHLHTNLGVDIRFCFCFCFFLKILFIYLREREWDRESMRGGKGQGEKQTPCWAGSPMWDSIPGFQDHDLSRRQMPTRPSHPGAPLLDSLIL